MMFPLGQMPSFEFTEEMRRKAFQDAIRQAGLGMMGASLGGARTGDAFAKGLLGGYQSYQNAPMMAQKQWKSQLDAQNDWISANKNAMELQKLGREQKDYDSQQDFFGMLTNPGRAAMAGGGGPSVTNLANAQRFANNPAAMLSDPTLNIRALQAGVKPSELGAALTNTRPYEQKPGMYYDGQYLPDPTRGIAFKNGRVSTLEGAPESMNAMRYAEKSGELMAQLGYDRARLPYDIQRAGGVARAEIEARDPFQFQTVTGPDGAPIAMTNPQARAAMGGTPNLFPNARVSPQEQAQRDAVRRGVLQSEGLDPNMPTRLNDRPGNGGLQPQIGIVGQSPATRVGIENTMRVLTEGREKVGVLRDSLEAIGQINEAISSGTYQGRFADWQTSAAAVASAIPGLGDVLDSKKLANSEVAAKHLSEQVLARIKMLGANPSNADREYIEKTVAQLRNNPQAFTRLLNYTQSMMAKSIESHNAAAERFHKVKGASPDDIGMDFRVAIPDATRKQREAIKWIMENGTPEEKRAAMQKGWVR